MIEYNEILIKNKTLLSFSFSTLTVQLGIEAVQGHKLRVVSLLQDLAILDNKYDITSPYCRQPVRDYNRRASFLSLFQCVLYNL